MFRLKYRRYNTNDGYEGGLRLGVSKESTTPPNLPSRKTSLDKKKRSWSHVVHKEVGVVDTSRSNWDPFKKHGNMLIWTKIDYVS